MKLCCTVEDKNSFDRHAMAVLKNGRIVGHVHVAMFCTQHGSLAARLFPLAVRLDVQNLWPQETVRDQ